MRPTLSDKPLIVITVNMQIKLSPLFLAILLTACAAPGQRNEAPDAPPPAASTPPAGGEESDAPRLPVDPDVLFHVLAAERLGVLADDEEAVLHYLEAARKSDDPAIAEEATRLALGAGYWDLAVAAAARWVELAPDDNTARNILVSAHLRAGNEDQALDGLVALVGQTEDEELAWQQVAALLGSIPDEDRARVLMDRLLQRVDSADSDAALWGQSVLAWRLGDLARAIELGEAAAERSGDPEQLIWTAQLSVANDDLDQALKLYRRAREQQPDDLETNLAIAEILRQLDRTAEAHEVLAALPDSMETLFTRGAWLAEDGETAAARKLYTRLAALEPDDPVVHAFYTGQLAELLEMHEAALDWYAQVDSGPLRVRATLRRALLMGELDRVPAARAVLDDLRRNAEPQVLERAWLAEAQLLQDAGQREAALDALSTALAELPDSIILLYSRALAAVELEDLELAEQDFRRILFLDPDNAMALNALGYTLTDRSDRHQEAYRLISRALEQEPDDPAILDSMGWVYFRLGQPEKALDYLERALDGEYNAEIAAHLGEVLWVLGEREQALRVFGDAHAEFPEDEYLSTTLDRLGIEL